MSDKTNFKQYKSELKNIYKDLKKYLDLKKKIYFNKLANYLK